MIPERPPFDPGDRFRDAARAYLVYGIVYWVGGVYLALNGIGVRGAMGPAGVSWIVLGLVLGAGVGIVAGVYPASRAARLDPILALRQE